MTVAQLAEACQEQATRFLAHEPSNDEFGLELLHRAIVHKDDLAWDALVAQYRGLVVASIRRHPLAHLLSDEEDDLAFHAFERFWRAIDAERLGYFPNLAAVLRYLKMCAHSVVLDAVRSRRDARAERLEDTIAPAVDPGNAVIGGVVAEQLWSAICQELQGESEERLAYLSFIEDLRPAEVRKWHANLFATTADVYRVKRLVLERLRRSPRIQHFLEARPTPSGSRD